jgi:hypothetical protein
LKLEPLPPEAFVGRRPGYFLRKLIVRPNFSTNIHKPRFAPTFLNKSIFAQTSFHTNQFLSKTLFTQTILYTSQLCTQPLLSVCASGHSAGGMPKHV